MSTPHSATSSSTSLPSTSSKQPAKPKPVNVFTNDGSFLARFQRSRQEEQDRQKTEEALAKKRQFADRFKNRGKRPPPPDDDDDPRPVTSTDLDPVPVKKTRLEGAPPLPPNSEYRQRAHDHAASVRKR